MSHVSKSEFANAHALLSRAGRPAALICEDDWLIGFSYAEALREGGVDALGPFATAEAALEAHAAEPARVAVIDLHLADGRSGIETARALHERGVDIIVCSGSPVLPTELADIRHVFLQKPVPPDVLSACVRAALRR